MDMGRTVFVAPQDRQAVRRIIPLEKLAPDRAASRHRPGWERFESIRILVVTVEHKSTPSTDHIVVEEDVAHPGYIGLPSPAVDSSRLKGAISEVDGRAPARAI